MTKLEVLHRLRQAGGEYVSSAVLCEELHLSRNSVWKAVNRLREEGYPITAVTNRGYRLELDEVPDQLQKERILEKLTTRMLGRSLCILPTVTSTNAYARPYADDPNKEGMVVLAEWQSAGRGKNGRRFESAEGGLYFSAILNPNRLMPALPKLRESVAHAVQNAIEIETGCVPVFAPPNELLVDGKKLCGILSEVRIESESERITSMIVGIGIYCNNRSFPEADGRVSLREITGHPVDRNALAAQVLNQIEENILTIH